MATASGLISSIQSLSTKVLHAIRGTPSTSHQQQDSSSPVRKDLEKLSRMLARIQAVQQDAEEREIHDCSVRLWLAELRGVAYQAEDVLDEFYYEVLRSIVESGDASIEAYHRDGGIKRKFAEMDPSSSTAFYSFSMIPYGMAEKIKGITERFQEISSARRNLHLREEDGTRLVIGPQIRPPTSSHVDERAIFGREKEKENIISLLNPLNDPEFMVLPIIGMGGLGKTTLTHSVYNDPKFLQLFDKRAWVSVSEDFDLVRLTRAIIESINRTTCEFSELSMLQDILKEKISHVSLFLVLDDVWNENTELWEHFQVALKGGKTVKILTTTRNTSVAEIMQTTSPIQLDRLPNEKCWSLFKHFAFDNGEASDNGKLLEIGYDIVKKCKGSPLVTKVLGGILRYEMDEEKWMEVLESDISEIDESGKFFTPLQLSYRKLPLHLKPCFVYLAMFPKGKRIEKDHVVRLWMAQGYINSNSRTKKTLEEIGSEYLNELQGRSLIDSWYNKCYVHDLIHDLARSISQRTNQPVLENDNLWNSSYKINHLYLTEKHELSDFLASCNNKVIRTYVRECPRCYIDDSAIFPKITCVRALELRNCLLPDTLNTMKHLRYLCIEDYKIESLPESLCLLYHLQTLDMNCHNILELPENIKSLINLRFLRLSSGKIKQLPESISLLHNLDTLSIEFCTNLEKLPRSIEQLTNLHVLNLSEYSIGNLSSGIGKLTNLMTLSGLFKVMGSDMTRGLGEFRDMNRLSGLMSITGLKNIGNIEYSMKANLVSKSNLRKLILNFEEDDVAPKRFLKYGYEDPFFYIAVSSSTNSKNENDEQIQEGVLESLQPHGNLTELVIINYRGRRVPPWLLDPSLMPKLTTLTLHFHMDFIFLSPLLGQLLHLKSLQICWSGDTIRKVGKEHLAEFLLAKYSSNQTRRVSLSSNQTRQVSFSLRNEPLFNNMLHLGEWQAGDEHCLEKLIINNCPKLWKVTIPQKLEVLEGNACGCQEIKFSSPSELKKLSISNCRELITIYYESGDLPFLKSISLSGLPNLSMLSAIPQKVEVLGVNTCGCQEIKFSSPSELKKLLISNCRELITIYYESGDLPFLESISLSGCPNLSMLSTIPQELKQLDIADCGFQEINFSSLSKLKKLSISNCRELITIYYKSGDLPFLKSISLSGCPNLSMLTDIPQKIEVFEVNACGCQEIKFSSSSELKKLSISNCRELSTIYYKSGDLPFLESISIFGCPNLLMLSAIPQELKQLDITDCGIQQINFSSLSKLKKLSISNCRELITINYKSGDLPFLESISLFGCPNLSMLTDIPQKVEVLEVNACGYQEIKFSSSSKLKRLSISNCRELITIDCKIGDLAFLESISLSRCPNLLMLSTIPQELKQLEIAYCGFQEMNFSSLAKLQKILILNCRELVSIYYKIGDLPFLESISLSGCPNFSMLSAIPQELKQLDIADCGFQEINFSSLSKLQEISISNCRDLVSIYYKIGGLPFLESISFSRCPNLSMLSAIPQELKQLDITDCGFQEINLSSLSKLQKISIFDCRELVSIYCKIGDISFLESISLSGCPNLSMLSAIPQQLKQLYIADCGFQEINFSTLSKLQKISIFSCRELVSIYYKIGDLHFLGSVSLSGCPKLLIFSAILEEIKQMDEINSGFHSEIQNDLMISDCGKSIRPFLGGVLLFNCPKLRIFSAIPALVDTLKIIHSGIHEIILPSRCQQLEIHNCPELISVHWMDGDSSSLPLVKFVDCPQLKLLKIPKEVEVLEIKSCGTHEIFFSSKSMVRSVDIYGCPELFLVHWLDGNVPFLKDLFIEGCPELISLPFLQGDLPILENFAIKSCPQFHEVLTIPYQLKELKIVDCCFPEIHLLPQSKLQRLIIRECTNLTAIKGLQVQFPAGHVSHPMMVMVEIRNCPRMDFGTQGNSYFCQVRSEKISNSAPAISCPLVVPYIWAGTWFGVAKEISKK